MLANLISKPLSQLTLGAQAHNRLNAMMIDDIVKAMAAHDWTCHVCGTRLQGMMEVDHLKGHRASSRDALRPICQFCHDREHLLWAASRKRLALIHAPDLSYDELSQLAWAMVGHTGREGFSLDRKKILRDLSARREDAQDAIGHGNLEAAMEAIFTLRDSRGDAAAQDILEGIDAQLKLAPSVIFEEAPRIQTWEQGGFKPVQDGWRDTVIPEGFAGYEALRAAGTSLKARL